MRARLVIDFAFGERGASKAETRGCFSAGYAELEDGMRFPLCFHDPGRLAQDLDTETDVGRPYITERGMIVVNTVTYDNMLLTVRDLASEGFFAK